MYGGWVLSDHGLLLALKTKLPETLSRPCKQSAHYQVNYILLVRTQPCHVWLLYSSNHACLTSAHILANSYFITCCTLPKLKDSEHGRYFRSPPFHSSTA